MSEIIIYWVYRFTNIILAPFYFHFGHHWLFIEVVLLVSNVVDTIGIFYIMFFFIISVLIIRNLTFQSFTKNFFKNFSVYLNRAPFLNFFSNFFKFFLTSTSFLVNRSYLYFKNFFKRK